MNYKLDNIEPYSGMELDCFQNLLVTLLNHYKLDIKYIGSVWPWQFRLENDTESVDTSSSKLRGELCVNKERLSFLYKAGLNIFDASEVDNIWPELKEKLDKQIPIIVTVDQYYIRHHFPHIFNKQHGLHYVMVTGYNDFSNEVYCVDTIPRYKGSMTLSELIMGIANWTHKYYTLDLPGEMFCQSEEVVFNEFLNTLKKIVLAQESKNLTISSDNVYSCNIHAYLEEIAQISDNDEIKNKLSILCKGNWGWEIGRVAKWLIEYLQMPFVKSKIHDVEKCIEIINRINNEWIIVYRLIFKGLHIKTNDCLVKSMQKLRNIISLEKELLSILLS